MYCMYAPVMLQRH